MMGGVGWYRMAVLATAMSRSEMELALRGESSSARSSGAGKTSGPLRSPDGSEDRGEGGWPPVRVSVAPAAGNRHLLRRFQASSGDKPSGWHSVFQYLRNRTSVTPSGKALDILNLSGSAVRAAACGLDGPELRNN